MQISNPIKAENSARAIFTYVVGTQPQTYLLDRFILALKKAEIFESLSVPKIAIFFPGLLGFWEPLKAKNTRAQSLEQAIRIASFITETDPTQSSKFCNFEQSRLKVLSSLFIRLCIESAYMFIRIVASVFSRKSK